MEEVANLLYSNIYLQALAVLTPIISFVLWIYSKAKNKRHADGLVIESKDEFLWFQKEVIAKKRTLLSALAHSLNFDILEASHFRKPSPSFPLLMHSDWLPTKPISLDKIDIETIEYQSPKVFPPNSLLPLKDKETTYPTFHDAIYELMKPRIFKSNPQYRIMGFQPNSDRYTIQISREADEYFSKIDFGKPMEYELAKSVISNKERFKNHFTIKDNLKWSSNNYRKKAVKALAKTPHSFHDIVVLGGISTLTLIYNEEENDFRFLMHERSTKQGYASGIKHVIPAGEYQPLNKSDRFEMDLPLWHNIMREMAEELANKPEYEEKEGKRIDYQSTEPFKSYSNARTNGDLKIYFAGFGLDPLSLQGEILTIMVVREHTFHTLFGKEPLEKNEEGFLISSDGKWGLPFTEKEVTNMQNMAVLAAGHTLLSVAIQQKPFLLSEMASSK